MQFLAGLTLIVLFGFLDRYWGGPVKYDGKKAVILAASVGGTALIAWLFMADPIAGAMFGGLWFVWRSLPFFTGSACPQTTKQRIATVLRNAPIVPSAALIAYWRGLPIEPTAWCFVAFALASISLAYAYGYATIEHKQQGEPGGTENRAVELLRGGAAGAAIAASLFMPFAA
jgi:hypothetical protein